MHAARALNAQRKRRQEKLEAHERRLSSAVSMRSMSRSPVPSDIDIEGASHKRKKKKNGSKNVDFAYVGFIIAILGAVPLLVGTFIQIPILWEIGLSLTLFGLLIGILFWCCDLCCNQRNKDEDNVNHGRKRSRATSRAGRPIAGGKVEDISSLKPVVINGLENGKSPSKKIPSLSVTNPSAVNSISGSTKALDLEDENKFSTENETLQKISSKSNKDDDVTHVNPSDIPATSMEESSPNSKKEDDGQIEIYTDSSPGLDKAVAPLEPLESEVSPLQQQGLDSQSPPELINDNDNEAGIEIGNDEMDVGEDEDELLVVSVISDEDHNNMIYGGSPNGGSNEQLIQLSKDMELLEDLETIESNVRSSVEMSTKNVENADEVTEIPENVTESTEIMAADEENAVEMPEKVELNEVIASEAITESPCDLNHIIDEIIATDDVNPQQEPPEGETETAEIIPVASEESSSPMKPSTSSKTITRSSSSIVGDKINSSIKHNSSTSSVSASGSRHFSKRPQLTHQKSVGKYSRISKEDSSKSMDQNQIEDGKSMKPITSASTAESSTKSMDIPTEIQFGI